MAKLCLSREARLAWNALSDFYTRRQLADVSTDVQLSVRREARLHGFVPGSGAYENLRMDVSSRYVSRLYDFAVTRLAMFPDCPVPVPVSPLRRVYG